MHFVGFFVVEMLLTLALTFEFQMFFKQGMNVTVVAMAIVFGIFSFGEAAKILFHAEGEEEDDSQ